MAYPGYIQEQPWFSC